MSNRERLIYLFQGLGVEYNSFVISINSRVDLPTIEEVNSLMLSYDLQLQRQILLPTLKFGPRKLGDIFS